MKEVISLLKAQIVELQDKREALADVANKEVLDLLDELIIETRGKLKGIEFSLENSGKSSKRVRDYSRLEIFNMIIPIIDLGSRFIVWLSENFPWS